jgi:putative sporulation protein YyaC
VYILNKGVEDVPNRDDLIGMKVHFKDKDAVDKLSEYLKKFIRNNTIILCIGTDKCIGDSLGPLVGTLLTDRNFNLPVIGTLEDPAHAVNLETKINFINQYYKHHFVIAVDACLGYSDFVGDIQVKLGPVSPGKGVGKKLPKVGDISIIGVVDTTDNSDIFAFNSTRLGFVMQMAKVITDAFIKAAKESL